jgi:hypothetical protein
MKQFIYTPAHLKFLEKTYQIHDVNKTTELFNAEFGLSKESKNIRSCLKNHKITCDRSGHFNKGQLPWNTGMKGLDLGGRSHETRFKKGDKPQNLREVGAERICPKDGYILIKVEEENPYTSAKTRFKHKHLVVWEEHNGPIPHGYKVRFLDGDKLNCAHENLVLVTNALHIHLNRFGYKDYPEELKESAMALCKLEVACFEAKKRAG